MKKQLIALAVAGAVAAPAMAQNVTIYGAIDMAIQSYDNGVTSMTRSTGGLINTTRMGISGSEDLGGGLKANFQMQQAGSDTTNPLAAGTSEELWVGVSGSFGDIRVGTTDMSGLQAMDSTVSGAGNLANSPKIGTTSTSADWKAGEEGADTASTIRYISPAINGVQLDVGYSSGNDSADTTDGNVAETSVYVTYKVGKLFVGAGQHEVDGVTNAKLSYRALGARYDFGMAAVGAIVSSGDASSSSNDANVKNTIITANVPLGKGLTAHVSRMSSKIENSATKATGTLVALTKELSKRTSVYGAYTALSNEAGTYSTWGGVGSASAAAADIKGMTVGISHKF